MGAPQEDSMTMVSKELEDSTAPLDTMQEGQNPSSNKRTSADGQGQQDQEMQQQQQPGGSDRAAATATKPLILFDLNGVLVNEAEWKGGGMRDWRARPGIELLLQLLPRYRLGVYSSATKRTILQALRVVKQALREAWVQGQGQGQGQSQIQGAVAQQQQQQQGEQFQIQIPADPQGAGQQAAQLGQGPGQVQDEPAGQQQEQEQQGGAQNSGAPGSSGPGQEGVGGQTTEQPQQQPQQQPPPPYFFDVLFHRDHCCPDEQWRQRPDGKSWDTLKPLAQNGVDPSQALLVDNELWKGLPEERGALLLATTFENMEDLGLGQWQALIQGLLQEIPPGAQDLKEFTPRLQQLLTSAPPATPEAVAAARVSIDAAAAAVAAEARPALPERPAKRPRGFAAALLEEQLEGPEGAAELAPELLQALGCVPAASLSPPERSQLAAQLASVLADRWLGQPDPEHEIAPAVAAGSGATAFATAAAPPRKARTASRMLPHVFEGLRRCYDYYPEGQAPQAPSPSDPAAATATNNDMWVDPAYGGAAAAVEAATAAGMYPWEAAVAAGQAAVAAQQQDLDRHLRVAVAGLLAAVEHWAGGSVEQSALHRLVMLAYDIHPVRTGVRTAASMTKDALQLLEEQGVAVRAMSQQQVQQQLEAQRATAAAAAAAKADPNALDLDLDDDMDSDPAPDGSNNKQDPDAGTSAPDAPNPAGVSDWLRPSQRWRLAQGAEGRAPPREDLGPLMATLKASMLTHLHPTPKPKPEPRDTDRGGHDAEQPGVGSDTATATATATAALSAPAAPGTAEAVAAAGDTAGPASAPDAAAAEATDLEDTWRKVLRHRDAVACALTGQLLAALAGASGGALADDVSTIWRALPSGLRVLFTAEKAGTCNAQRMRAMARERWLRALPLPPSNDYTFTPRYLPTPEALHASLTALQQAALQASQSLRAMACSMTNKPGAGGGTGGGGGAGAGGAGAGGQSGAGDRSKDARDGPAGPGAAGDSADGGAAGASGPAGAADGAGAPPGAALATAGATAGTADAGAAAAGGQRKRQKKGGRQQQEEGQEVAAPAGLAGAAAATLAVASASSAEAAALPSDVRALLYPEGELGTWGSSPLGTSPPARGGAATAVDPGAAGAAVQGGALAPVPPAPKSRKEKMRERSQRRWLEKQRLRELREQQQQEQQQEQQQGDGGSGEQRVEQGSGTSEGSSSSSSSSEDEDGGDAGVDPVTRRYSDATGGSGSGDGSDDDDSSDSGSSSSDDEDDVSSSGSGSSSTSDDEDDDDGDDEDEDVPGSSAAQPAKRLRGATAADISQGVAALDRVASGSSSDPDPDLDPSRHRGLGYKSGAPSPGAPSSPAATADPAATAALQRQLQGLPQVEVPGEAEAVDALMRQCPPILPSPRRLQAEAGHKRGRALAGSEPLYNGPWMLQPPSLQGAVPQTDAGAAGGGAQPPPRLSQLHYDVQAFAEAACPQQRDLERVGAALRAIDMVARSIWPQARAMLFGSQASGLALPGSDLDVVILGVMKDLQRPAEGFGAAQREQAQSSLRLLARRMQDVGLLQNFEVIRAKVPIIKASLVGLDQALPVPSDAGAASQQQRQQQQRRSSGSSASLLADISMGVANGLAAVSLVQQCVLRLPPLRPLCLVLKAMLKESGLNEVFTGGLSSFSLVNMVVAHLQCEGYDIGMVVRELERGTPSRSSSAAASSSSSSSSVLGLSAPQLSYLASLGPRCRRLLHCDLGEMLRAFLARFGRHFSYKECAVSIVGCGVVVKQAGWRQSNRQLLAVEDPQQPGKDIGGGSYNILGVKDLFARMADRAAAAASCRPAVRGRPTASAGRGGEGEEEEEEDERAMWARVQADGQSRSLAGQPPASTSGPSAAPSALPPMPALGQLLNVELALNRAHSNRQSQQGVWGRGPPKRAARSRSRNGSVILGMDNTRGQLGDIQWGNKEVRDSMWRDYSDEGDDDMHGRQGGGDFEDAYDGDGLIGYDEVDEEMAFNLEGEGGRGGADLRDDDDDEEDWRAAPPPEWVAKAAQKQVRHEAKQRKKERRKERKHLGVMRAAGLAVDGPGGGSGPFGGSPSSHHAHHHAHSHHHSHHHQDQGHHHHSHHSPHHHHHQKDGQSQAQRQQTKSKKRKAPSSASGQQQQQEQGGSSKKRSKKMTAQQRINQDWLANPPIKSSNSNKNSNLGGGGGGGGSGGGLVIFGSPHWRELQKQQQQRSHGGSSKKGGGGSGKRGSGAGASGKKKGGSSGSFSPHGKKQKGGGKQPGSPGSGRQQQAARQKKKGSQHAKRHSASGGHGGGGGRGWAGA